MIFWCGVTRSLEKLTEEFNRNFLVKKSEIVSLKPEHQSETHFLKRRISVDEFVCMLSWIKDM